LGWEKLPVLEIRGLGRYQRTKVDKYGFPLGYLMKEKSAHGFQTGDLVAGMKTKGETRGVALGGGPSGKAVILIIKTKNGKVDIFWKDCRL
jgi:hypothetical protein